MEWPFPKCWHALDFPVLKLIPPRAERPFSPIRRPRGPRRRVALRALGCGRAGLAVGVASAAPAVEGAEGACAERCQEHPSSACCSCRTPSRRLLDFGGSLGPSAWKWLLVCNIKGLDHRGKRVSSFFPTPLVSTGEAGRCDEPLNRTSWPAQADGK